MKKEYKLIEKYLIKRGKLLITQIEEIDLLNKENIDGWNLESHSVFTVDCDLVASFIFSKEIKTIESEIIPEKKCEHPENYICPNCCQNPISHPVTEHCIVCMEP